MIQQRIPDVQTPAARATDPVTSHELAEIALLDYYTIMRRVSELETGGFVRRGEKRKCKWWAK